MSDAMAEYVRHHRCYNADPNVSIADWDRGVLAIEREAVAQALTVEQVWSAIPEDWSPFWQEEPNGDGSITATFDRWAFAAAIRAKLAGEP